MSTLKPPRWRTRFLLGLLAITLVSHQTNSHWIVEARYRAAPLSDFPGTGWRCEAYLGLPDQDAIQLLSAKEYMAVNQPDFTFRTTYIDFPAGDPAAAPDVSMPTMGDFLDDYIFDVSDPNMLNAPLGNFVLKFTGHIAIQLDHSIRLPWGLPELYGVPIFFDLATSAYGAHDVLVGITPFYSVADTNFDGELRTDNSFVRAVGIYPIQLIYLNRFDDDGSLNHELAGVELYSWQSGGLELPTGAAFDVLGLGRATVVPPKYVYQPEDLPLPIKGDADDDSASSLTDFQNLQNCHTGSGTFTLSATCQTLDFDWDNDIDILDLQIFAGSMSGPETYAFLKGDFDANQVIDLADFQFLQGCRSPQIEDRLLMVPSGPCGSPLNCGCEIMDFDNDVDVDAVDIRLFLEVFTGP